MLGRLLSDVRSASARALARDVISGRVCLVSENGWLQEGWSAIGRFLHDFLFPAVVGFSQVGPTSKHLISKASWVQALWVNVASLIQITHIWYISTQPRRHTNIQVAIVDAWTYIQPPCGLHRRIYNLHVGRIDAYTTLYNYKKVILPG